MDNTISGNELIVNLANVRRTLTAARALKKESFEKWQKENALILSVIENNEQEDAELVAAIRERYESEAAIVMNDKGEPVPQNRQPHPAIKLQMKDTTIIKYDKASAFNYCLRNLTTALALDVKYFELVAKTNKLPVNIVTVVAGKKVSATIATDLDEYSTNLR